MQVEVIHTVTAYYDLLSHDEGSLLELRHDGFRVRYVARIASKGEKGLG
jgi:hypothetical protein